MFIRVNGPLFKFNFKILQTHMNSLVKKYCLIQNQSISSTGISFAVKKNGSKRLVTAERMNITLEYTSKKMFSIEDWIILTKEIIDCIQVLKYCLKIQCIDLDNKVVFEHSLCGL